jgi:TPR repeat protein
MEEIRIEEAERRKREARYFEAGKKAYEYGQYQTSVEYLEKAVEQAGRETGLGGEALMWLALGYQVTRGGLGFKWGLGDKGLGEI